MPYMTPHQRVCQIVEGMTSNVAARGVSCKMIGEDQVRISIHSYERTSDLQMSRRALEREITKMPERIARIYRTQSGGAELTMELLDIVDASQMLSTNFSGKSDGAFFGNAGPVQRTSMVIVQGFFRVFDDTDEE